ncbi:hypothetical protein DPMN_015655 [Dreissena polymorpha]|uniref:Uncharacterized protein n=1 Tax=Dreissena polymorpha TaxID=45954 RepID=A0A9D4NBY1_DREPO|nr:hypothetical protein DPMN_015655 [Dreissena polymorpha]
MTPTRLIHNVHSTIFPISARSSRPIREPYTISARPCGAQLNRHQIFTRPDRDGRTTVVQSRERSCIETLRIKT